MESIYSEQRAAALALLEKHVENKNLIKHMIACEVVMARLAKHFNEEEALWALTGLLHDIDYDTTKDDPLLHSKKGAEMLEQAGYEPALVYAVKVHNPAHGEERKTLLDKALYAVDPLTGLITAGALIKKEKSLYAIDTDFLVKRFAEKSFARGANREQIAACQELGLTLEEFISLGLEAMQASAQELGLAGKQ